MMNVIVVSIAIIIALLDTTWLSDVQFFGTRPDLVLIVLVYHAHYRGVQRGQLTGFGVGLVEDVLSAAPLGFFALVRMGVSAVLGLTNGNIRGDTVLTPMLLVLIGFVIRFLLTLALTILFGMAAMTGQLVTATTLIELLLTVVFAPVIFFLLRRVANRFERRGGLS
ncbi:MAG: rod shape-determining protein MreD [Spirochaeta sp.]|jgi:rod shape-determining protein MreD|nr:rod shape-determining protein MreD [Spirochaeta sp.]